MLPKDKSLQLATMILDDNEFDGELDFNTDCLVNLRSFSAINTNLIVKSLELDDLPQQLNTMRLQPDVNLIHSHD